MLLQNIQQEQKEIFATPQKTHIPIPPEQLAAQVFKNLIKSDDRFNDKSDKESISLIKIDKKLRSEITKTIKSKIGSQVSNELLTSALGFQIGDDFEEPSLTEIASKTRDGVIDSLIIEQAKLKQNREEMIYEILKLKKENGIN